MRKPILIITCKEDVHADFVTMEIRKLGGDIIRLNTEDMVHNACFSMSKEASSMPWEVCLSLKDSGKTITGDNFDTIWYRKPMKVEVPTSISEQHAKECIQDEYDYFLRSLYTLWSGKRWINPFWNLRMASQKLPNLELAAKLGLQIPRTLITNDPEKAYSFGETCDWKLLVKTFDFSGFVINQTEAWHCFAHRVTKEEFLRFAGGILLSPVFFQEYIEKSIELRVTIIGRTAR